MEDKPKRAKLPNVLLGVRLVSPAHPPRWEFVWRDPSEETAEAGGENRGFSAHVESRQASDPVDSPGMT